MNSTFGPNVRCNILRAEAVFFLGVRVGEGRKVLIKDGLFRFFNFGSVTKTREIYMFITSLLFQVQ